MALGKSEKSWRGVGVCFVHCLIYTLAVCLFMWNFNPLFVGLVFASHYPIDRWSLADKWLAVIRGRTFKTALASESALRELDIAFTCLVYAVVDNTMHLILLWLTTKIV